MNSLSRILLFIAVCTIPANAQVIEPSPLGHVVHYIKNHKRLLISDTVILAALAADAGSSTNCQHVLKANCLETNAILGKHPSDAATWSLLMGYGSGMVAIDHLSFWYADKYGDNTYKWLVLIPTIAIPGWEGPNTWANVCVTEHGKPPLTPIQRVALARARFGNGS